MTVLRVTFRLQILCVSCILHLFLLQQQLHVCGKLMCAFRKHIFTSFSFRYGIEWINCTIIIFIK